MLRFMHFFRSDACVARGASPDQLHTRTRTQVVVSRTAESLTCVDGKVRVRRGMVSLSKNNGGKKRKEVEVERCVCGQGVTVGTRTCV